MAELHNSSPVTISTASPPAQAKKRRSLPGMPDPDAEVIALSPKTLMATNRFVCEICSKGFQRDQNLQLHRRGHNLPWKLRQRAAGEVVRKRVYVCPEMSCVHHNPSRALGDLTGIKKHFSRKHGEKRWKCERCSKKYAVKSDWKAHMKTCGTREYKCDCGTLFSRRDSFITHRAFCDALAEESARARTVISAPAIETNGPDDPDKTIVPLPSPPLTPSVGVMSPALSIQSSELPENHTELVRGGLGSSSSCGSTMFASLFSSTAPGGMVQASALSAAELSLSLYVSNGGGSSIFRSSADQCYAAPPPAMSATALLQKAAQMGAATSSSALWLRGMGLTMSSSDLRDRAYEAG